ncbi:MAG: hypothetical protein BM560_15775 [Roseobacter sp. MedPE-SWde]|nr:MAG: hypothetical protein BM560_15775 [Roseobacter sp. MedPE-SWde]
MAFVSIVFGSVFGLLSAITGFALFDLHVWQSLLLYSTTGVLFAALSITVLVLRSGLASQSPSLEEQATASA